MIFPYQIKSIEEYHKQYKESIENPNKFWFDIAQHFTWKEKPKDISNALQWNFIEPKIECFSDATLNITENCLDRHLKSNGDKPAIIWEPNHPDTPNQIITYSQLFQRVCAFAEGLQNIGVKKGDRVCIYMGMVPELAIAVLACARIGAIHSVVFGGFSAQSITDRIIDAHAEFVITQDVALRGNKNIDLKSIVDEALNDIAFVKKVIVFQHSFEKINLNTSRDIYWNEVIKTTSNKTYKPYTAIETKAEDPLFILYTSGSTGKPKGVVHTCAGYMLYTHYTFINVFQYQPEQVHFCTADIGWITGHSYIIYGPLISGATTLMFEGIPTFPDIGRLWDIVEKYHVNILYTAPTAIRSLMTFGNFIFENKNLSSLQILGTVGEPINEEAWNWYNDNVGKGKCPIVDTWWQTETGGIMISNLAGITPQKPTYATLPMPGVIPVLLDENGNEIAYSASDNPELPKEIINGNLCIKQAWPSILRTTYNDHERCRMNYFATYKNLYFTGDGCFRDTEGNYRITGRVDDVLNVSGHRIGTAEVENAINMQKDVVESAVVAYPHDIKGQGIYAFCIVQNQNNINESEIKQAIIACVQKQIGAIAKPDKIQIVSGLPKTRSGKIMRRILRKIAENEIQNIGDTTTLLDPSIVQEIIQNRIT